jgi:catalase
MAILRIDSRRPPALIPQLALAVGALFLAGASPVSAQTAVDPEQVVDAFEGTFGKHAGARRSFVRGVCFEGTFTGRKEAQALSKAALFSGDTYPVFGRFGVSGSTPTSSDKAKTPRGLSFKVTMPNGEEFVTASISAPVFGASTPEQLVGLLQSRKPDPTTKMPDPAKVKAFDDANPEIKAQGAYLASQPVPASFATVRYFGVNTFKATNPEGKVGFVRWSFEPAAGVKGLTAEELAALPAEFLFDEARKRAAAGPISFTFNLHVGEPGDEKAKATETWPETRRIVPAGTLTITKVEPGLDGACKDVTFDPLVLPSGLDPTDDPLLLARSPVYAVSLTRRLNPGN